MNQFIRWFFTAALVYVAAVAYVTAAIYLVSTVSAAYLDSVERFWTAMEWGTLAGVIMGPILGLTVLRDVNRSVRLPEDEVRWWPKANRRVLITAAVVVVLGLAGALFVGGAAWLRGFAPEAVRYRIAWGFMMGSLFGGAAATFGPFALNRGIAEE